MHIKSITEQTERAMNQAHVEGGVFAPKSSQKVPGIVDALRKLGASVRSRIGKITK